MKNAPTKEIRLKIHDESEMFSPMDPDQRLLSEDVIDYLSRVFLNKHRRLRENFVITIVSDEPVNEERVRTAIREEFDRQKDDVKYSLKRLMLKLICLAVLGAAILSLWLYFSANYETVGVEILSIMGWVCVWEATSIAILQRPDLRRMWLNLDRLLRSDIRVQTAEPAQDGGSD